MRLILIRHTRPAVTDDLCYGVKDVDVAATFEEEAARVVAALPAVERLVTSPLRRCTRLAERIGAARGLVPVVDERLGEMDFGRWQGLSWAVIERTELDAWAADFLDARPHGGESVRMVTERVGAALADFGRSGTCHALVTHGGVIKVARALSGATDAWTGQVDFGAAVEVKPLTEPDLARFRPHDEGAWT